jgi:histidyl-tRNA synthetase
VGAAAVDALLAPLEPADLPLAARLAEELRDDGRRVELDIKIRGARASLRHADRVGIPLVVLVGSRERERGELVVRAMAERRERTIMIDDLRPTVRAALAGRD